MSDNIDGSASQGALRQIWLIRCSSPFAFVDDRESSCPSCGEAAEWSEESQDPVCLADEPCSAERMIAALLAPRADFASHGTLVPFSAITAKPIHWAWENRIALGKLTALAGRPKIGKGLLWTLLAAQVTTGRLQGGLSGSRAVIVLTTEDDPGDTLRPRLEAAGADLDQVYMLRMGSPEDPVPFTVPGDVDELARLVEQTNAALVVVDPLLEFLNGKTDSHKSHPVRQAVASLNAIARETGCAILVIFHLNKGPQPTR